MLKLPGDVASLPQECGLDRAVQLQRMRWTQAMQAYNQVTILHQPQAAVMKPTQRAVTQIQERRDPAQ